MERRRTQREPGAAGSTIGPHSFQRSESPPPVATQTAVDLHVCPACASDLVYPVDWEPAGRDAWRVSLRCPGCEWTGGGEYPQAVVDRFDEALDQGMAQLIDDLRLLARANMEEDVERLVAALHAGAILPEDF